MFHVLNNEETPFWEKGNGADGILRLVVDNFLKHSLILPEELIINGQHYSRESTSDCKWTEVLLGASALFFLLFRFVCLFVVVFRLLLLLFCFVSPRLTYM